jgi:hypothetical protein
MLNSSILVQDVVALEFIDVAGQFMDRNRRQTAQALQDLSHRGLAQPALEFENPGDYDTIDQGDTLGIQQLRDALANKDILQVDNLTKKSTFTVPHRLSSRQAQDVLAGGLIGPMLARWLAMPSIRASITPYVNRRSRQTSIVASGIAAATALKTEDRLNFDAHHGRD